MGMGAASLIGEGIDRAFKPGESNILPTEFRNAVNAAGGADAYTNAMKAKIAANPLAVAPAAPAPAQAGPQAGVIPPATAAPAITAPPSPYQTTMPSTVPYQPMKRAVAPDGTIQITGSGQSPEYLAAQQAKGLDAAGRPLSDESPYRITRPTEGGQAGVPSYDKFKRMSPREQKVFSEYAKLEQNSAAMGLTKAQIETSKAALDRTMQNFRKEDQVIELRAKILAEPDAAKRKPFENQLHALLGKPEQKYQIITQDETENGLPVKRAYINLGPRPDGNPNIIPLTDYLSQAGASSGATVSKDKIDRIKAAKGWSDKQIDEYLKANSLTRGR